MMKRSSSPDILDLESQSPINRGGGGGGGSSPMLSAASTSSSSASAPASSLLSSSSSSLPWGSNSQRLNGVVIALSLNVCSSVGIVFANKFLFKHYAFGFGTTLTVLHFLFCFAALVLLAKFEVFEYKKLGILQVLPISLAFSGYVVFNNLSLVHNSISFYQVMKILVTPCILVIQATWYNERTDLQTILSLIPICIGIFITVVTDASINFTGTMWSLAAMISNALYTIWGKTEQKRLQVDSTQILLYQSIISALILIFFVPIFENFNDLLNYPFTMGQMTTALITCVLAFGVNFSFFLLVGKTSPLTVNVVGYFKTVLVFVGGVLFFDEDFNIKKRIGITLTCIGLLFYTIVKSQVKK